MYAKILPDVVAVTIMNSNAWTHPVFHFNGSATISKTVPWEKMRKIVSFANMRSSVANQTTNAFQISGDVISTMIALMDPMRLTAMITTMKQEILTMND